MERFGKARGATALTYGLVVGLVALAGLSAVTRIGDSTTTLFTQVSSTLTQSVAKPEGSAATPQQTPTVYANCAEAHGFGARTDGPYTLDPDGDGEYLFTATCDMTQQGGGWTLCGVYLDGYDQTNVGIGYLTGLYHPGATELGLTTPGSFCHTLSFSELMAETYTGSTAGSLYLRTQPLAISDTAFQPNRQTRITAGTDTIGLHTRTSYALTSPTGGGAMVGTTCGDTGNNNHQGQIICVGTTGNASTGGAARYQLVYGGLNNTPVGAYPYGTGIVMCNTDTWCGSGNPNNRVLLYVR